LEREEKKNIPHYGTINFEKRRQPRFNVDLPVEYARSSLVVKHGRVANASEGGLLVYFPEKMEVGQHLSLKIFFSSGAELNTIETLMEVVWTDIDLGKDWGDYRTGVKFVDVSSEDMEKLKSFLGSLSG
jgi:c-di-GMP-binding flagellar brake protein YcgR